MRMRTWVMVWLVGAGLVAPAANAQTSKIDLRTKAGAEKVKGQWRYHDVKIIEVDGKGPPPESKPVRTYSFEPRAEKPDFDDSKWDVLDPTTLGQRRANGQLCFNWYRIKITIPPEAEGKTVHFVTTVDDYGEVWVDGKLNYKAGTTGGSVVAGFNTPNRVELKDAKAGKTYQIAVFGINGPISATPGNWIFLGDTFLEITDKK
ncbi:MAG: hypothetical protein JWN86_2311 [Planctomycetota bacterium]|nr:hypothetical protein [Planctomycetota bacterium]